jgi:transposase-like protein
MSRRNYTDAEKQQILGRLLVNGGDIPLTSAQTGVPDRTLVRWKTKYLAPTPPPPPSANGYGTPHPAIPPSIPPIAADAAQALRDLQHQMMEEASYLTAAIRPAIAEASLSQRVIALTRLVDRIYKLAFQLPNTQDDLYVEYDIVGAETFERNDDDEDEYGADDEGGY